MVYLTRLAFQICLVFETVSGYLCTTKICKRLHLIVNTLHKILFKLLFVEKNNYSVSQNALLVAILLPFGVTTRAYSGNYVVKLNEFILYTLFYGYKNNHYKGIFQTAPFDRQAKLSLFILQKKRDKPIL
jgi:hypothetical protein